MLDNILRASVYSARKEGQLVIALCNLETSIKGSLIHISHLHIHKYRKHENVTVCRPKLSKSIYIAYFNSCHNI